MPIGCAFGRLPFVGHPDRKETLCFVCGGTSGFGLSRRPPGRTEAVNLHYDGATTDDSDKNPNYLTGPKTKTLFTDETRKTVRPSAEFKAAWEALNDVDREDIKRACTANRDVSYNPLCTNAKGM